MLKDTLRKLILNQGDLLFGVANVMPFRQNWTELPEGCIVGMDKAVSIAVPLSRKVLDSVEICPTKLYSYHYKQINYFLDRMGLLVMNFLQANGFEALPVPASQTIDHAKQKAHLSHRHIAVAAGLGWMGRNNLLVTPKYGSVVRLVSILTNAPLEIDSPLNTDCGECVNCVSACPAGSIKIDPKEFDKESCYKKLCEFQKLPGVGHHICGICVRACVGRKR